LIDLKKKKKQRIIWASITIIVVAAVIGYNYNIEQVKIKGGVFGNELKNIQEEVAKLQNEFSTNDVALEENDLTKQEFLEYSKEHFQDMEELISRYDDLEPPLNFDSAVELFKLSTETQLERDKQIALWIETGDEAYNIRADRLHQESFAYELSALAEYKEAQTGKSP